MEIIKYFHHKGQIARLIKQHPAFDALKQVTLRNPAPYRWKNTENQHEELQIQVSFFGKSGYGKSSTVNAFFGKDILTTSDVAACTQQCDCLDFEITKDFFLSFADFPGIGESEYQDQKYLKMYRDFLKTSCAVVYVLRADLRDYAIDEQAFAKIFPTKKDRQKVMLAINCCDKIEPVSRKAGTEPTPAQMDNIAKKIDSLRKIFGQDTLIIPYSAQTGWNLDALAKGIVSTLRKNQDLHFPLTKEELKLTALRMARQRLTDILADEVESKKVREAKAELIGKAIAGIGKEGPKDDVPPATTDAAAPAEAAQPWAVRMR